jgi:hypothetical protein
LKRANIKGKGKAKSPSPSHSDWNPEDQDQDDSDLDDIREIESPIPSPMIHESPKSLPTHSPEPEQHNQDKRYVNSSVE